MLVENNVQCFDVASDPVILYLLKIFFKMVDNILKHVMTHHIKYTGKWSCSVMFDYLKNQVNN